MVDGNIVLIKELSDRNNQEKIRKVISKIIKKSGILKNEKNWKDVIQFIPYASKTDKCTLFFKINSTETVTNEEITIVIRPDNNIEHRVLRVVVQEGNKIIQKKEDYDKGLFFKKSDVAIFKKEIAAIENDIRIILKHYLEQKLNKSKH